MDKVQEIVLEMKRISEGTVLKTDFETKTAELLTAIEQRGKDIEEKMKSERESRIAEIEQEFKTKLDEVVDKFKAKTQVPGGPTPPDPEIYGKSFGDFLVKVRNEDMKLKALSENVGASGGYLVPTTWSSDILQMAIEGSIIRNNGARVINMPTPLFDIPAIKATSQSGSVYGGIITYWGNESTNMSNSASQPAFGKIALSANKLFGYIESYEDLTNDAIVAISPLIQQLMADGINFEEDYQFINGNGVGKPLGILSSPCLATVSRATASTVNTEDITGMLGAFAGRYDRAVWKCNQTTLTYLLRLQDAAGNYIWMPGMSGSISAFSPGLLYGIPLIVSEKCPALGSLGDIILSDLSNYIIGDLGDLRIEESPHYKFGEDLRAWKLVKRVDGKPWLSGKITPKNGTAISPFVALQ